MGELRAGLEPNAIEKYRSIHGESWQKILIKDLSQCIKSYEKLRRDIDDRIDALMSDQGLTIDEQLPPAEHVKLLEQLPESLREKEQKLRRNFS